MIYTAYPDNGIATYNKLARYPVKLLKLNN